MARFGAAGKTEQKAKFKYLINNGRTNLVWQNAFMDQHNDFVMDRMPYPFIEIGSEDMAELNVNAGDLVEIYNESGSTQAMVYPTPSAKKGQTFMLFACPTGVQGNVINAGVNELIIPNHKQTWADIRKLADAFASLTHSSPPPLTMWMKRMGLLALAPTPVLIDVYAEPSLFIEARQPLPPRTTRDP